MVKKSSNSMRRQLIFLSVGTIVATLLLSACVFWVMTSNVLGQYLKNDLVFALNETIGNLNSKTVLMEDMVLRLRKDTVIVDALSANKMPIQSSISNEVTAALTNNADLFSEKNICAEQIPFIEAVYLFDNYGTYNRTSYHDNVSSIQAQIDDLQMSHFKRFSEQAADILVIPSQNSISIICTLYDDYMDGLGTIMFVISRDAIEGLLGKASDYKNAFWILYDKNEKVIMENNAASFSQIQQKELFSLKSNAVSEYVFDGTKYLVLTKLMGIGLAATLAVPENQLSELLYTALLPYLIVMLVCISVAGVMLFLRTAHITKPLSEIAGNLEYVSQKQFNVKLPEYNSKELSTISEAFNTMTSTINHLINDVYEKKLIAMDSEIKVLQSQINPHFMYNVLHTIAIKAKLDGNEDVYRMVSNFAMLTRARLSHSGDDKITLEQELQYVKFYLELQKYRFEEKLQYNISIQSQALLSCVIPRLTVEMIVENAVVHGVEPKDGCGTVFIDISEQDHDVIIIIEDDGVGFANQDGEIPLPIKIESLSDKTHNHIAINTAYRLLQYFYGPEYGISINSRKGIGTFVTIRIPKEEVQKNDANNDSR